MTYQPRTPYRCSRCREPGYQARHCKVTDPKGPSQAAIWQSLVWYQARQHNQLAALAKAVVVAHWRARQPDAHPEDNEALNTAVAALAAEVAP